MFIVIFYNAVTGIRLSIYGPFYSAADAERFKDHETEPGEWAEVVYVRGETAID